MPSTMQLFLLLFCQIYFVSAKLQLHPKFAVIERNSSSHLGDYFTALAPTEWIPSRQTVLYHLTRLKPIIKLIVTIEDLPRNENIRMKFKYRCSPSDTEGVHEIGHSFLLTGSYKQFCDKAMPISISTNFSAWISDTTYQLKLDVLPTYESKVPLNDVLEHNLRIQLEFIGDHWRLESNGLFLRSWDPLLGFKSKPEGGEKYARQFLTADAIEIMKSMNIHSTHPNQWKPFIANEIKDIIQKAPLFVQQTISMGAMLSINGGTCDGSNEKAISFMSSNYMYNYKHASMIGIYVDLERRHIMYIPKGLRPLASSLVTERDPVPTECDDASKAKGCRADKICALVAFNSISGAPLHERDVNIHTFRRSDNPYQGFLTWMLEEVQLMTCQPSIHHGILDVHVFARAASFYLRCPIVCARLNEKFTFYRGDAILEPQPDQEFTQHGAVSVHKSGAVLMFSQRVTHEDAGPYKCKAGNQKGTTDVKIISLPAFSIRDTALVGGELPPRIYARIGGDYAVNCTVFYSGMGSVTLTPEFYIAVAEINKKPSWSKLTGDAFIERLTFFGSEAKITVSSKSYSTTLTLTVTNVPEPTAGFDFSHRFVCNAAASAADMKRYGVSEYSVQSGSDAIIVPLPTADEIEAKMSPCCASGCFGKKCIIMYSLKPELINRIKSIGLDVRGRFKIGARNLSTEANFTYDASSVSLKFETDQGVLEMAEEERKWFLKLVPVFEYFLPSGSGSIISTKPPLPSSSGTGKSGAVLCDSDPSCYASTESDKSLMESLTIGAKFVLDGKCSLEKLKENVLAASNSVRIIQWALLTAVCSLCAVAISYALSNRYHK